MSETVDPDLLRDVVSKLALHELCAAYARGIDRADETLLASLFHDDSVVVSGVLDGTGPEFARGIVAFVKQNFDRCSHHVSNEWFDVRGDEAVGESYVIAAVTTGGQEMLVGGRYLDAFQRRSGSWRFSRRTFVLDWTRAQASLPASEDAQASGPMRGVMGCDDPVYGVWDRS